MAKVSEVHDGSFCDCDYGKRHLLVTDTEMTELTTLVAIPRLPRPDSARLGMTRIGVLRDEYSATVEGQPGRFRKGDFGYEVNPEYFEWTHRSDLWASGLPGTV